MSAVHEPTCHPDTRCTVCYSHDEIADAESFDAAHDHRRCANSVLDEDGERVCECGDEGRLCESCAAKESAYWSAQFLAAPLSERDPEAYAQDMREAGRGHLVQS